MLRSFRARLLAAALVVAVVAIAVTAWVTNRTTSDDLARKVEKDLLVEQTIYEELTIFAITEPDWDEVAELVDELAEEFDRRIAVAGLDGRILADSDEERALPNAPAAIIDPANPLIEFVPESATAVAEIDLFNTESKALADYLDERDIPYKWFTDDFGFSFPVWDESDPEANEAVDEFFESGGLFDSDDVGSLVIGGFASGIFDPGAFAEPALLYIEAAGVSTLAAVFSGRLLLAVLIVAAAAVAVTVVLSRRLMRPITALTGAAQGLESGDLSRHVELDENGEIGALAETFNSMAASLERSDELRRTMTADIAHELRTPLANINGYLEAARDGVVPSDDKLLATVHEEAVLLQHLVEDLETLTQADAGRLPLDRAPTPLVEIVAQVVEAHRARAETAGVELVADAGGEMIVSVDAMRIRRALGSFVDNALRHTPAGGSVKVDVRSADVAAVITVADTGEGIAPEHLPHVFDRFYRADPSRTRATGGSGLGMAIARQVVEAHGGTVAAASTVGEGTTITLQLPAQ